MLDNPKEKLISLADKYSFISSSGFSSNIFISFLSLFFISKILEEKNYTEPAKKISKLLKEKNREYTIESVNEIIYKINELEEIKNIFGEFDPKKLGLSNNTVYELLEDLNHLVSAPSKFEYGDLFSTTLDHIASSIGKRSSIFHTPKSVVKLLINILSPEENKTIYDPFCGSGELLVGAIKHINEKNNNISKTFLYGHDNNNSVLNLAKQNIFINGCSVENVSLSNCLNPKNFNTFDYVITNPPFSVRWDDRENHLQNTEKFIYGVPPKSNADYVFIQHCIASLNQNGKAAIIVSPSSLRRHGVEGDIRKRIIEDNIIEAIVKLPGRLFDNTDISVNILIFSKSSTSKSIFFLDASDYFSTSGKKNSISDESIKTISDILIKKEIVGSVSSTVSIVDILKNRGVLSVEAYVKKEKSFNIEESLDDLLNTQTELADRLSLLNTEFSILVNKSSSK